MQKNQREPDNSGESGRRNIRLVVEYDGTRYVGWQRQKNGLSIQEALETALEKVMLEPVRLSAAGRTDAGVHALGQVVNFRTNSQLPLRAIEHAALVHLPPDIAVHSAVEAPESFDSRRSARLRWYRYHLCNRKIRPAVGANYLTHVPSRLNVDKMRAAAAALSGPHDFQAFRAVSCTATRTRLTMHPIEIHTLDNDIIQIDYRCRSFLQNMVRILTGSIVAAGRSKLSLESIEEMLTTGKRRNEAVTFPPQGLFLYRVFYEEGGGT